MGLDSDLKQEVDFPIRIIDIRDINIDSLSPTIDTLDPMRHIITLEHIVLPDPLSTTLTLNPVDEL